MNIPKYAITVFWSEEDGLWLADVPDLRYCTTHGNTPVEAIAHAADAIAGWLEVAREDGLAVPEPSYRPPAVAHAAG